MPRGSLIARPPVSVTIPTRGVDAKMGMLGLRLLDEAMRLRLVAAKFAPKK